MASLLYWKILVVDDDEDDFLMLKSTLALLEHVTVDWVWSRTAQEALQQLETGHFDVILTDYYLGSEHGLDLIQTAVEAGVQPPMILLSGQGNYEMDRKAMQSGAYFFLDKNELSPHVLERTIRYAIDRRAIELELKQREDKLRLLAELSKDFVEAGLNYHQVLDTVARRVSQTFYDAIIFRILDKTGANLEPAAVCHPDPQVCDQLVSLLGQNQDDRLLEEISRSRQGRILRRADWSSLPAAVHSPFASWLDRQHILSLLVVPLQVQYKPLGAMILMRTRHKPPFQREDLEFFQELADRASLSIENARLYIEEAEQTRHLQALQAATQALLRTLDFDQLTRKILEAILKAIPLAGEATLFLQTPESTELELQGIRCVREDEHFQTYHLEGAIPVSIYLHQVINEGQSLKVDSFPFTVGSSNGEQAGSFLAVPLVMEAEMYGVLTLTAFQEGAFLQRDLNFLEDFSATIIAALHNARLHEKVQHMALTDSLTGLLNRRGFFSFAGREFLRAQRLEKAITVIMLDIDLFKTINDTYGHSFGDRVLQVLAGNCMSNVRKIDLLGRYGGDEFIILLPDTRASRAKLIAERIRECFENTDFEVEPRRYVKFTASFGIAQTNGNSESLDELIKKADSALYASKQKGRNRVEVQAEKKSTV